MPVPDVALDQLAETIVRRLEDRGYGHLAVSHFALCELVELMLDHLPHAKADVRAVPILPVMSNRFAEGTYRVRS